MAFGFARKIKGMFALLLLWTVGSGSAWATEKLVLYFMVSSGTQRTAWVDMVDSFKVANPDSGVTHKEFAQEDYKKNFDRYLTKDKVDVAFWFAGERMRTLVQRQLLAPLDPAFVELTAAKLLARAPLAAGAIGAQHYAFPLSYYPWGFFYRKSTFARLGLAAPKDWSEFLAACAALHAANIVPTAVGAQAGWPAAAWFDYLNLRSNGLEFHQRLLRGRVEFTDERVRNVMEQWKILLDRGYFLAESVGMDWDRVLPYLYRERVGMVLLGGFAAAKFAGNVVSEDIGFFGFPRIDAKIPAAEDAPLDVLVLPSKGENRAAAHRFLTFLATSQALNQYNDAVKTFSPLVKGQSSTDQLFRSSKTILDGATGISFF